MTGKKCTAAADPPVVQIKRLSDGLFDVVICDEVKPVKIKNKNRETGVMEENDGYSFMVYAGIVNTTSRERFIAECIHVRYSIDDEIALIHKYASDKDNEEYASYQTLRAAVKEAAAEHFRREAA